MVSQSVRHLLGVVVLAMTLFNLACASMAKDAQGTDEPQRAPVRQLGPPPENTRLVFKGRPGAVSEAEFFSLARTLNYSEAQLVLDRQESVDFDVRTQIVSVDEKSIASEVRTVRKDGTTNLHELAFPELGEAIDFVIRPSGQVLKAGSYAPQSLFFVPSLPMPSSDVAVSVGDTWTLDHEWISAQQLPMKLSVVGILKGFVACVDDPEFGGYCADIEVSGSVRLPGELMAQGARFTSRVWGRVLFSLERGDVVRSEMRSEEEVAAGTERTVVTSCMVSRLKGRASERPKCTAL